MRVLAAGAKLADRTNLGFHIDGFKCGLNSTAWERPRILSGGLTDSQPQPPHRISHKEFLGDDFSVNELPPYRAQIIHAKRGPDGGRYGDGIICIDINSNTHGFTHIRVILFPKSIKAAGAGGGCG